MLGDYETYPYDDLGNRDGTVGLYQSDGTPISTTSYAVDDETNRYTDIGSNTPQYDDAWNLTADHRGYLYEYDYENRLERIYEMDGQTEVEIAAYAYDALGRRIEVKTYVNNTLDTKTRYYYNDKWQVLSEYDGSGDLARWYVYGNFIDEPLVMVDETVVNETVTDPAYRYYAHDHLYSTVALMEEDANGDIQVLERYEYTAYGQPTITDGTYSTTYTTSQYANPYMFTGRRLDILDSNDLQLQYNRNRYYDAEVGRWLTQDPLGYVDGMSLYEYVKSKTNAFIDPFGTTIYPKSGIGGSYRSFLKGESRFIYTCKCGWLDKSHFLSWKDEYSKTYQAIEDISNKKKDETGLLTLEYNGGYGSLFNTYSITNGPSIEFNYFNNMVEIKYLLYQKNRIKYTALGIMADLFIYGEATQHGSLQLVSNHLGNSLASEIFPLLGDELKRFPTQNSLEDLPTNWVGAMYAAESYIPGLVIGPASDGNMKEGEKILIKFCGEVLTEKQAKCLHSEMSTAEHMQKNYSISPILFNHKSSCTKTCAGKKKSDIFISDLNAARQMYQTYVKLESSKYKSTVY